MTSTAQVETVPVSRHSASQHWQREVLGSPPRFQFEQHLPRWKITQISFSLCVITYLSYVQSHSEQEISRRFWVRARGGSHSCPDIHSYHRTCCAANSPHTADTNAHSKQSKQLLCVQTCPCFCPLTELPLGIGTGKSSVSVLKMKL